VVVVVLVVMVAAAAAVDDGVDGGGGGATRTYTDWLLWHDWNCLLNNVWRGLRSCQTGMKGHGGGKRAEDWHEYSHADQQEVVVEP
jgi:hypothetical protein